MNVLEMKDVCFSYETGSCIFSNLNLEIEQGETVGIIGANGSGKSTLFKLIAGLLAYEGTIRVNQTQLDKKNLTAIRRDLGFVFQNADHQLFLTRVVEDMSFGPKNYGFSPQETELLVDEALQKVGISHLKYRHNITLSGGEKRMVCIAMILAMHPKLMLFDEPSTELDPYNRRKLINVLKDLQGTKLISSHDLDMIWDTCDRVIMLKNGSIRADGRTKDILSNKSLLEECHLELPLRLQRI